MLKPVLGLSAHNIARSLLRRENYRSQVVPLTLYVGIIEMVPGTDLNDLAKDSMLIPFPEAIKVLYTPYMRECTELLEKLLPGCELHLVVNFITYGDMWVVLDSRSLAQPEQLERAS